MTGVDVHHKSGRELFTLLDLCVSSLRKGHANLLCIVPMLTHDCPTTEAVAGSGAGSVEAGFGTAAPHSRWKRSCSCVGTCGCRGVKFATSPNIVAWSKRIGSPQGHCCIGGVPQISSVKVDPHPRHIHRHVKHAMVGRPERFIPSIDRMPNQLAFEYTQEKSPHDILPTKQFDNKILLMQNEV